MIRILILVMAVAILATGCGSARVGVVNTDRVLNESPRALRYQHDLDEREKAMATDLRLLVGQLPPADFEARRAQYLRELQALKAELEGRLNEEIRQAVAEVAEERRLRTPVLVRQPVIHARPDRTIDITDEVIARLK